MIGLLIGLIALSPAPLTWESAATGGAIDGYVHPRPIGATKPTATVIYLTKLSIPRAGSATDHQIITDLATNCDVIVLNYRGDAKAISPNLNSDVLKIRQDLAAKKTPLAKLVKHPDRLFVIPEGFSVKREVEFARDGERVLAMDVIYSVNTKSNAPVLMEITCDNVNRMGNGSLVFCRDTLIEGAALAGFAGAMVDHPVRPPYKGLDDPMPESIERMKAAAAKLREIGPELGLSGKVGAIGFSRGGPFAAILAGAGDVQAALVHGNRYDYLKLRDDDPMLARFEKAWGRRDVNPDRWAEHGAVKYLTKDAAPMFLNTSDTESPEYRDGLAIFARRLEEMGGKHVYQVDADGRGHRVSTDLQTLKLIYQFLMTHLQS